MIRSLLLLLAALVLSGPAVATDIRSTVDAAALPQATRTGLGLYLTPKDAAAALKDDPSIIFLDVRDPIEITFVGHPTPITAIVPIETATLEFDATAGAYRMATNPHFIADVDRVLTHRGLGKDATIFVMCRSGGRSAVAVNALAEAGYRHVWNLVEGFEGDKSEAGARTLNGWRSAGLPWTYKITRKQAWTPTP